MALNSRVTCGSKKPPEAVKWDRVALRCTRCVFIEKKEEREGKERKKPRWRERRRSGGEGGATRPRDRRPGRRALGDSEAYCARVSGCACMRARLSTGTPRAGAAWVKQIRKLLRSARAPRPPQLERCLPGAPASRAPHRRGRTCGTRRSTFLKAVQPPYVAQCPRGLPAADQWLSARLPFHSAARRLRPRRESDCSAARPPRRQPTRLPWGSCGPASPARPLPSSSAVPPRFFPSLSLSPFSHFLLPDLCRAYPALPTPLCLFLLPGFTGSP